MLCGCRWRFPRTLPAVGSTASLALRATRLPSSLRSRGLLQSSRAADGARGTALRASPVGLWLYVAGATVLDAGLLLPRPEAAITAGAASSFAFCPTTESSLGAATALATLLSHRSDRLVATLRKLRAPGMAGGACGLRLGGRDLLLCCWHRPVLLSALTICCGDELKDLLAGGRRGAAALAALSWIFTGATSLSDAALAAIAEIVPPSRRRSQPRRGDGADRHRGPRHHGLAANMMRRDRVGGCTSR